MRYSIISPTEYRLYSVGWNESDELGIVAGYGTKKSFQRHEEGDWVWFSDGPLPNDKRHLISGTEIVCLASFTISLPPE